MALLKILEEYSDEDHPLTQPKLLELIDTIYHVTLDRRTLYSNIEMLVNNVLFEYLIVEMEEYREPFRKKLDSVYDVMHNGGFPQINGAIQNILPEVLDAEEVYSEVPFTYREEKRSGTESLT